MKSLGMKLLAVVGIILVLIVAFFMVAAFLTIFAVAVTLFLVWWGTGQKIPVKQDGKRVGTLRWFTFTRTR